MATMILEQSGTGNANMQVQLTYTAGAGAINITAIKGRRTDGYDTLGSGSKNRVHITIGDETFTLTPSASDSYYIRFTKNSVWSSAWAGVSASRDDVQGNQKIKITFTCPYTANIANSVFEGTINAGYKTPSMTLSVSSRGLNYINFNYSYTNAAPEKIEIYNETTGKTVYSGTDLSPSVTGLSRGTTYKFKIRGYANGEWGAYSSSVSATTYTGATVTAITSSISNTSPIITVTYSNDSGVTPTYTLKDASGGLNKSGNLSNTITLTSSEITTLMNEYPNYKAITLTLTVTTGSDITSTKTTIFNIVDSNPTLGTITYVDTNSKTTSMTASDTQIIVGQSTVSLTIPKMSSKNGAQEGSYTVSVDNITVKTITGDGSSSYTTDIGTIPKSNSVVQVTAIDSRENSVVVPVSLTLFAYNKPSAGATKTTRKDLIGEETTLSATGTYTHFADFDDNNSITKMEYRYSIQEDTLSWSDTKEITGYTAADGNWSINNFVLEGDTDTGFDIENTYLIEVFIYDELSSSSVIIPIKGANPTLWIDKKNRRLGVGKKPEKTLDVVGDMNVDGAFNTKGIASFNSSIKDKYNLEVRNGLAYYESSGLADPNNVLEELILTQNNTPTSSFWYVRTLFYSRKTTDTNRTQIAYPYNDNSGAIYERHCVEGTWSSWTKVGGSSNVSLEQVYPVGSIYMNVSNTSNPKNIFGFGTWVAIAGLTLVGAGSYTDSAGTAQTFTAGTVTGAYTHRHTQGDHKHARGTLTAAIALDASYIYSRWDTTSNDNGTQTASWSRNARKPVSGTNSNNSATMSEGTPVYGNTGSVTATTYTSYASTIQPSLPVYMWKRTA